MGKVSRRALVPDGNIIGKYDNNQYLNSVMYKVEFIDSQVKQYGPTSLQKTYCTK